ncbi:MAG TPA: hypothetical protein VFG03_17315 [Telluria sp.]|nr:hypothetical protein [Telluria sp.]
MAKVKMAGKQNDAAHEGIREGFIDYNATHADWQALCPRPFRGAARKRL